MPFGGLLTVGLIAAGGAIGSSAISAHASGKAADQQTTAAQNALNYTKEVEGPYINAGNVSLASLMEALKNGTFGAGSTGNIPNDFKAPTLEEAQQTPGYQFTAQQGSKGILQGAAAAGGAISGGTLRALDTFNTGLANTTYGDAFTRSLQQYQASLAGYGARLAGQQQEFNQLYLPTQLGANAAAGTSTNVGNLMTQVGNAQSAGTIGTANAISGGISGATNSILQSVLIGNLNGAGKNPGFATTGNGAVTIGPNGNVVPYTGGPG